ncbi:efflux RND transporter periplasmic adaptor subunit [Scytonema sp. UIC 10036]|uniref:efflux RND transporter periplasmic adaptor subunit n=1 Tax=Scytonema sp. UIC 10036 TaxID=2304196 RepID=UPI0012DA05FA|nr:efflux RND transporter periplasmic adaptor subunit [Scytonema sp. UIC 10036]MUG93337.1 efflux RND transporter periplasmic adaptor subunit [Scytonema sp. UIC 10036]
MKHFEDTKQTRAGTQDGKDSRFSVVVLPQTQEEIDQQTSTADEADIDDTSPETDRKPPSPKKRNWLLTLGAIALLIGGVFGWRWWQNNNAQEQSPPGQSQSQAVPVRISTVQTATIRDSAEFVANLESRRAVTLQPETQGRVSQIFVKPGNQVQTGTPIIQINPDEQQAALSGATAAVAAAQAEVKSARATLSSLEAERLSNQSQLKLSQEQYQRYSNLATQGAVSRETRDQYFNELQAARSSLAAINKRIEAQGAVVAQSEKAVQQAQANAQQSQAQLQNYRVTAPFAGTVGNIPVKVGDIVTTSTQLTTITQNQPLEVNISIPLQQAPRVRVGTPVQLLNPQGQNIGTSKVFFISPQTANDTQSVLIKALFDNAKGQLRADSFVRARVIWEQRPGVLIPTEAISRVAGQTFVYVAQQQEQNQQGQAQLIARQKLVKLGDIQGNSYQVLEGLKPGEKIIVAGLFNLRDGAPITPAS